MNPKTFTWHPLKSLHFRSEAWRSLWSWVSLLIMALILFGYNLDTPNLLDSERIIAKVVEEMAEGGFLSGDWLFPTLHDQPYHQYPVLGLLCLTFGNYQVEPPSGSLRIIGAIFTAISVPLFYTLAREIFVLWRPAFLSALVYLMSFPVVRWGRLALLDGMVLFWAILTVLCVLRARRDFRWSLGVGLSLSGLFLTQGLVGVFLTVILIIFLAWDTPRLLSSIYFWIGLSLGLLPALTWYWMQWLVYGQSFLNDIFLASFDMSWSGFFTSITYYPLAVVKYSWPWLIFAIYGFKLAKRSVNWGWAKLILVWGSVYSLIICLLPLHTMSYLLPFYPPFALATGLMLSEVNDWPDEMTYPRPWYYSLLILSGTILLIAFYLLLNVSGHFDEVFDVFLLNLILIAIAWTGLVTGTLMIRRNPQFIPVLFWGTYISLILMISSSYWATDKINL
ncbi:MAG: glycosyltransferase family 39 protein [Crocosphaera sp.]|nr:glycosyltransferase family 39 protein [Crocosphaera sp.]